MVDREKIREAVEILSRIKSAYHTSTSEICICDYCRLDEKQLDTLLTLANDYLGRSYRDNGK